MGSRLSFYTTVWFLSTVICLILEGSSLGTNEQSVIRELSLFTTLKIGGLITIPAPNLLFFHGIYRVLTWDYSFYSGSFMYVKYFWMVVLDPAIVIDLGVACMYVYANFLKVL